MMPEQCALQLILAHQESANIERPLLSSSSIYLIYLLDFEERLARFSSTAVYSIIIIISTLILTLIVKLTQPPLDADKYKFE